MKLLIISLGFLLLSLILGCEKEEPPERLARPNPDYLSPEQLSSLIKLSKDKQTIEGYKKLCRYFWTIEDDIDRALQYAKLASDQGDEEATEWIADLNDIKDWRNNPPGWGDQIKVTDLPSKKK